MLKKTTTLTLKEYLYHKEIITQQNLYYNPEPDKQNKIAKWVEEVVFPMLKNNDINAFQELAKDVMQCEMIKEVLSKKRVIKSKVIAK